MQEEVKELSQDLVGQAEQKLISFRAWKRAIDSELTAICESAKKFQDKLRNAATGQSSEDDDDSGSGFLTIYKDVDYLACIQLDTLRLGAMLGEEDQKWASEVQAAQESQSQFMGNMQSLMNRQIIEVEEFLR